MAVDIKDRINIFDIAVDRPVGRTVDFYLERDIYDSDWKGLAESFERIRSSGPYDNRYLTIALALKVLRPDSLEQSEFLEVDVGQVKKCIRLEDNRDAYNALDQGAKAQLIFPGHDQFIMGFFGSLDLGQTLATVQNLFSKAVSSSHDTVKDPVTQRFVFNKIKNGDDEPPIKGYELALLRIASSDLDLDTNEYINACKDQLRIARINNDWVRFAQNLFSLSVLAARDVKLDEEGLYLSFGPPLTNHDQSITNLPD